MGITNSTGLHAATYEVTTEALWLICTSAAVQYSRVFEYKKGPLCLP